MSNTPVSVLDESVVSRDAIAPKIVTLANGNILVAYADPTDGGYHIRGKLYDPYGEPIGDGEFTFDLDGHLADEPDFDIVATRGGGVQLVAEVQEFSLGTEGITQNDRYIDTMLSRGYSFGPDGQPDPGALDFHVVDSDDPLFAFDREDMTNPAITQSEDGTQHVFYINKDEAENFVVYGSRPGQPDDPIKPFSGNGDAELDAVTLKNGNIVLILDRDGKGSGGEIYYRIMRPDHSYIESGDIVDNDARLFDSTVTALKGGGFVIAWAQDDGFDTDVQFQVFNADGEPATGVRNGPNGVGAAADNNNEPYVVALNDGGFIVLIDKDKGAPGIWGQRYDDEGHKIGELFRVTADNAVGIDATLLDDGRIAVTWQVFGTQKVEMEILSVTATNGDDILQGAASDDLIRGLDGDDLIRGGRGDDEIHGDAGDDTIIGGKGDDNLYGGSGSDVFVFRTGDGNDHVRGFNATNDGEKIDLTAVDSIKDFSDLRKNHMTQVGNDVVIDTGGGNSIRLHAVDIDELGPEDFILKFNTVEGTDGEDVLTGSAGADLIRDFAGNDVIEGGAGDDIMIDGDGSDIYVFRTGHGNDEIRRFTTGEDTIDLRAVEGVSSFAELKARMQQIDGDVVIDTGNGDSITLRNVDIDVLDADDFVLPFNLIEGTEGDDQLIGTKDDDEIRGLGGNDLIAGGEGNDLLDGGGGADRFWFSDGHGVDEITGFDAAEGDVMDLREVSAIRHFVDLRDNHMYQDGDDVVIDTGDGNSIRLHSVNIDDLDEISFNLRYHAVLGTEGDDDLTGTDANDEIHGFGGDDVLDGGEGDDALFGGEGADTFVFGDGAGTDFIHDLELGVDKVDLRGAAAIKDFTDLRANHMRQYGNDVEIIIGNGESIFLKNIDLEDLGAEDFLLSHASVDGTDASEVLLGTDGADVVRDLAGDDIISGGKGDDTFVGGSGSDTYIFADDDGADEIRNFDAANDRLDLRQVSGLESYAELAAHMRQEGNDVVIDTGDGSSITLKSVQLEDITTANVALSESGSTQIGTSAGDNLSGTWRDDLLLGADGSDLLQGGRGSDTLLGGTGDDTLIGGRGHDVLDGGEGDDLLLGGRGEDTFVFKDLAGNDTILDFDTVEDRIDLSGLTEIETFDDLFANHIHQEGDAVVIEGLSGDTITIEVIQLNQLTQEHFIF